MRVFIIARVKRKVQRGMLFIGKEGKDATIGKLSHDTSQRKHASAKLTRAELNKRFGDADLSKDKSGLESPPEFWRSWRRRIELRRNHVELDIYHR
ncbi:hypothetical protein Tco_1112946 [Tanacetum coccineum]|uniref:Uncharacterized protein n=1 Tax=Tanacetum coccineum TaxID=301880 RepID=A0ABQ5ITH9_9ASTR